MARKFNSGRQGEQLLNKEFHELFMTLKYLNYNYKDVSDEALLQERQTEIPTHALRIKSKEDINFIETYDNQKEWQPIFEGYYHPADTRKGDINFAAPYQLCIDPYTGALMYKDPSNNSWVFAKAALYEGETNTFNGLNYQFIHPLKKTTNRYSLNRSAIELYPVPYTYYGRLFSNKIFKRCVDDNYIAINDCAIETSLNNLSWVHVNASKLVKIDKRLIKIQTDNTKIDYGFISVTSSNTEFYGICLPNIHGELLIRDIDYIDTAGGIKLIDPIKYQYIYTLTYGFDDTPITEGSVLQKTDIIGEQNEIYVGQIQDRLTLFIDGLSLEETDENDNAIYNYNSNDGVITFTDDEDAEIINNMQMTSLVFPARTDEFTIAKQSKNVIINNDKVLVKLNTGNNVTGFTRPMVFCSGLGLQQTDIFEDVQINENNTIVINNFVVAENEKYKMFVVDTKNSYVSRGTLTSDTILDLNIDSEKQYVVFVNGILMTPTNGDITILDGSIKLTDSYDVVYDNLDYVIFEIDNKNEDKIGLVFDDTISYYSIRIDDYNDESVYDNCNSAIVYIDGKIVVDEAAVKKPINALEGYYKGGQIVKLFDDYGNYKYYIHDYIEEEPIELDSTQQKIIEDIIGYYSTSGSIHLLGDNSANAGCEITYFAYNYANLIDEILILGDSDDLHIPIGDSDFTYYGKANKFEAWSAGNEALSTYVNGLIIENEEYQIENNTTRQFTIEHPYMKVKQNINYYGDKDIVDALNRIFIAYGDKTKEYLDSIPDILSWGIDGENTKPLISDYFSSVKLFYEGLSLSKYINKDMTKNRCSYAIEKLEQYEYVSAYRNWIDFNTAPGKAQIYTPVQDSIIADFLLAPGFINVYLNGVLLDPVDYIKFNKNKIAFNIDICGLQNLSDQMNECLPDYLTDYDKAYMNNAYSTSDTILRIIEDKPYYIPSTYKDTILIEKRSDTTIKQATFNIEATSYGSFSFTEDYYDFPDSLFDTQDKIKIYINGVYYGDDYTMLNSGGIRGIRLNDQDALVIDPIYMHFQINPDEYEKYKLKYGNYQRSIDKITFEWR